jgi:hypothetical protein
MTEEDKHRELWVLLNAAEKLKAAFVPVPQHSRCDAIFRIDGRDWTVEVKSRRPKFKSRVVKGGLQLIDHKYRYLQDHTPALLLLSFGYNEVYVHRMPERVERETVTVNYKHVNAPGQPRKQGEFVLIPFAELEQLV